MIDAATVNNLTAQQMVEQLIMRVGDMPLYVAFDIRHSTLTVYV
ncbi:hypothetical protein [Shewanella sp. Arc9-LZ]